MGGIIDGGKQNGIGKEFEKGYHSTFDASFFSPLEYTHTQKNIQMK